MAVQNNSGKSFTVNAAMSAFRRVLLSSNGSIGLAGSGDFGNGVLQRDVTADSFAVAPVRFYEAGSFRCVVSAAPGTAAGFAYAASSGTVAPTGTVTLGTFMESFTSNGVVVEVLPIL